MRPIPPQKPRVVIIGATGQLGTELTARYRAEGCPILALSRSELDVTDASAVESAVATFDPGIVFNAAAYNMVDLAEKEPAAAFQVNALAVRNIAVACRQAGARLVHFSTDYVFDGRTDRAYVETDAPHPLSAYAVSKLAGELYAQAYLDDALILRTSGVFGPAGLGTPRGNFIETMLRLAHRGQTIRVVEDHVASPTYAPELARCAVELAAAGASGVFHAGGGVAISWYDYARLIFRLAGLEPTLQPTNEREHRTAARRPKYSALSNSRMDAAGIRPMMTLEETVADYLVRRKAKGAGA